MSSEITPVSCDTELTVIRNEHSEISASATSDMLPENECDHQWVNKAGAGYRATSVAICVKCYAEKGCVHVYGYVTEPRIPWFEYCPRCGEKLEEND